MKTMYKFYAFITGTEPRQRKPRTIKIDLGVDDSFSTETFNLFERKLLRLIKDKRIKLASLSGKISAYSYSELDKENESSGLIVIKLNASASQLILLPKSEV